MRLRTAQEIETLKDIIINQDIQDIYQMLLQNDYSFLSDILDNYYADMTLDELREMVRFRKSKSE